MLTRENQKRKNKKYEKGEIIFAKNNRRDKKCAAYTKHTVKEDIGETVITDKNVKIHKDTIRS